MRINGNNFSWALEELKTQREIMTPEPLYKKERDKQRKKNVFVRKNHLSFLINDLRSPGMK